MNENYEKALELILEHEGGYVHHKDDHGGATNMGVTQESYDSFLRRNGHRPRPVSMITNDEVKSIYREYWEKAKCDELKDGVDIIHFDMAVNAGTHQAAKILQRAVGVTADGIIGPITLGRIKLMKAADIINNYTDRRISFYIGLVERDITQLVFLRGWIRRAVSFLNEGEV